MKKFIKKKITKRWISASKTRNFALNDPLLDYLKKYNLTDLKDKPKKSIFKKKFFKKKKKTLKDANTFLDYLLINGILFEEEIYKKLKSKFNDDIVKICESEESRNIKYFNKTVEEMKKGTKIIYQGVLCDFEKEVFGVPDLIVRSDVLNDIFDNIIISRIDQKINAPLINSNNYHYRIIDIKNSMLHLNVDEKTIRNSINIKPFKTQIYIYNNCLGKIQGYNPTESYILGKGWILEKQVNKQIIKQSSSNPFDKPGIIDIDNYDSQYNYLSDDAINWLKYLNNEKNLNFNFKKPLNKYLYPNMNNNMDGKYRKIKIQISQKIGEITNIWNCGIDNRQNAINNNIYSWKSKDCNSQILGIKGKRAKIIDTMLSFHRNKNNIIKINNDIPNTNKWLDKDTVSFYVDFETFNNDSNSNIIFMIGLGWDYNNEWNFKNYIIKNNSDEEEERILNNFVNDLSELCKKYKIINPNIFHWSHAEPSIYNKVKNKYRNLPDLNWFDLLNIFKNNLILIKDCYNYSLKSVSKEFYNKKFINTTWEDNVVDGLDAMFQAWKIYKNDTNVENNKIIKNIQKYNEIDCKVMYELIIFIRNYLEK